MQEPDTAALEGNKRSALQREPAAREHPKIVETRRIASVLCVAGSVFMVLAMIFDAPFGWPALAGLGFGAALGISAGASRGLRPRTGCGVGTGIIAP